MTIRKLFISICSISLLLVCAGQTHATLITFDLNYSGASFGNNATGVGSVTFDDTVLPNPGILENVTDATLGVTAFSITIANASSGNGTFGLTDVDNWIWDTSAPLYLSQELVGQVGFNDFNWCGFNFDGCVSPAPGGTAPFVIQTNAETGDSLLLSSMTPQAAPEPATLALIGLGLAGLGFTRRKMKA